MQIYMQYAIYLNRKSISHKNSNMVLTVQREHGVKDLALHLSCTLRGAAHPQPLIKTHGCDDSIACVRRLLPLGQGGGGDDANPTTQCKEIT